MRAFVNNEIGRTEVMDKCPFQPTLFWGHPLITEYRWQLEVLEPATSACYSR